MGVAELGGVSVQSLRPKRMRVKRWIVSPFSILAVSVALLDGAEIQTQSYERAVAALNAEQQKYQAGKSTLFNVCQVAKDLRRIELQMSSSSTQRMAAHQRHVVLLQGLKRATDERIGKGLVAPPDGKLVAQELNEAEAELRRAKGGTN